MLQPDAAMRYFVYLLNENDETPSINQNVRCDSKNFYLKLNNIIKMSDNLKFIYYSYLLGGMKGVKSVRNILACANGCWHAIAL